jgi:RNA polymerase sigma factor (sigma-70 family)
LSDKVEWFLEARFASSRTKPPNSILPLQQTSHAIQALLSFHALSRVSRLLSYVVGSRPGNIAMLPNARTLLGHLRRLAPPTAPDAALLADWLSRRDEGAFAALVARHGPMVLGVCRRILGDMHHAEDVFQATFLVLARQAALLRRPEALASYLYSIALRLARKSRGKTLRRPLHTGPDAPEPIDPHPDPLDVRSGRERVTLLDEEVARLPERYRLPLLLCVLQERTVEEVAHLLGWTAGSVRGRLTRGRERLRKRLARRGLCLSAGGAALLGPRAVPERLLAESVRNLTGPASGAVSALAGAAGLALKPLAAYLGLFLLAAVCLGAGLGLLPPADPEPPSTRAPAAPPAPAAEEPRRDRLGAPLPPEATARLGTVRFRTADEVAALAFAPNGRLIAASSRAGLFLFETGSGKRLQRLPNSEASGSPDNSILFSPDGKRLVSRDQAMVDRQFKGVVRIWEVGGSKKPQEHAADHHVWAGWSPDGEPLAVCLEKGAVCLHELASGRLRRLSPGSWSWWMDSACLARVTRWTRKLRRKA